MLLFHIEAKRNGIYVRAAIDGKIRKNIRQEKKKKTFQTYDVFHPLPTLKSP